MKSQSLPATALHLKNKLLEIQNVAEQSIVVRIHRSISWYKASEQYQTDPDIHFISLWVSFNACYALDKSNESVRNIHEHLTSEEFFKKLIECDPSGRLYHLLWKRFSKEVRLLIGNKYLYKSFWDDITAGTSLNDAIVEQTVNRANRLLGNGDTAGLIEIVFNRLYVLRNQLFHGGSTYKSRINRQQVHDGGQLLLHIMPVIIELLIENHTENWGEIPFPVVG